MLIRIVPGYRGFDYRCIYNGVKISEAINLLRNVDLSEKKVSH